MTNQRIKSLTFLNIHCNLSNIESTNFNFISEQKDFDFISGHQTTVYNQKIFEKKNQTKKSEIFLGLQYLYGKKLSKK